MLRRTKILTTLGPATDNPKTLAELLRAGADVDVEVEIQRFEFGDDKKVFVHGQRASEHEAIAVDIGSIIVDFRREQVGEVDVSIVERRGVGSARQGEPPTGFLARKSGWRFSPAIISR